MTLARSRRGGPPSRGRVAPLRLLLVALLAAPFGCDDPLGVDGAIVSEPFVFERDATGRAGFRLSGINGNITIGTGTQGELFRVTGRRRVRNCDQLRAEGWIDELEVQVTETVDEIVVRTVQPLETGSCSLEVEYELTVPARLAARVVNTNGAILVRGLNAGVSVTNVNGDVGVEGVAGSTRVRLTNGNIAGDVAISGEEAVDLVTVNGNVDLGVPRSTSAEVTASVTNGTIGVANLPLTDVSSTQTSLTGRLGTGEGEIVVRTTNGNITLRGV